MPDSAQPLISVVLRVYNTEAFVADAINSVLAQTYPHFELIIVDNGSTDGSPAILRAFAARDSRIRLLCLPHGEAGYSANAGVAAARGEFIAYLDSDDIALPERFAVQLAWMRRTGVDICGGSALRFGSESGILWFPEGQEAIRHELLFRIGLLQPTVLLRAEVAKSNPYDERLCFEDYEMWTRLALRYRMGNVPQVLVKHRCHARQKHVQEIVEFRDEVRVFRRAHFRALFPQASQEDYAALARVCEKEPLESLGDLERAGNWLVRLAQTPDTFLRQKMLQRWATSCRQSAHLGVGAYRLYQQIAPRFEAPFDKKASPLKLACALRLRPESSLATTLQRLKHKLVRTEHAAA